jgi:hypothetical protein
MATDTTHSLPDEIADAPTGWQVVATSDSVVQLIDALLDLPAHREFNKTELADFADVSRKSVHNYIGLLLEIELITEVPDTSPQRYRFNTESEVAELLIRLDGAVNKAGPHSE